MVLETSPAATRLAEQLDRRFTLQKNKLFPSIMQVECRQPGCVGIGYLGFETVMCFICEEQWALTEMDEIEALPPVVKPCPKCGVKIEKIGGCKFLPYPFLAPPIVY